MSLSNGTMRLTILTSKFSCCLYCVKIFCIRTEFYLQETFVFCKVLSHLLLQRVSIKLLFEIYVVEFHFAPTSTKKSCRVYLGNEMSLFCYITRSFSLAVTTFLSHCN